MAVEIGALRALLSLDSTAFETGAKRAQASMNGLQRSMARVSQRMQRVGRTLSTRVSAPLAAVGAVALRSSLQTIDAQSKMAQSLDTSTRSMQVLARAADRAGLSTGELEQLGRQLTRRLSQAAAGAGPAADALEQLGLSAESLTGLDLDERIARINEAIAENIPASQRAAVAAKVFGDRAGLLATRLDAGVIRDASEEIERFGLAVTEIEADRIEEANDAISALGLVSRGLANQLAVALAPTLKAIAERIADVGQWFADLSPRMQRLVGVAASLAAAAGPLAIALGFMATGLAAIASPIGLVVLGLGAVAGAAVYVASRWEELVEKLPKLGPIAERVGAAIRGAWDRLGELATGVADAMRQAVEDIKATLAALPGEVLQIGRDVITALRDGIVQRWQEVKEAVTSVLSLSDFDAKETGARISGDLATGMVLGVSRNRAASEEAVREYLRSLEGAARDEAESNSPSKAWMRLGRDLMSGLSIGIGDGASAAAEAARKASERVTDAVSETESVLGTFKAGAQTVTRDVLTDVRSMSDSIEGVLRGIGNRLIDTGLSQGLDFVFPTPRALGGPVMAGRPYLVGERGPELMVPRQAGTIVPNGDLRGGGQVSGGGVTVNVHGYGEPQVTESPGRVDVDFTRRLENEIRRPGKVRTAVREVK